MKYLLLIGILIQTLSADLFVIYKLNNENYYDSYVTYDSYIIKSNFKRLSYDEYIKDRSDCYNYSIISVNITGTQDNIVIDCKK